LIQLVIPLAGKGSRFLESKFSQPKPLIPIHGWPMIQHVLANLVNEQVSKVVLVSRREFGLEKTISSTIAGFPGTIFQVLNLDHYTDGPAETANLAMPLLDPDQPLVIANSDQYINSDLTEFHSAVLSARYSGVVMTMEDNDPKWSYVELNSVGMVAKIVEKEVVSSFATTGVYGFGSASLFAEAYDRMRKANDRTNGEFYVGPSYNFLETNAFPILNFGVGPIGGVMFGLGVPKDLEQFLSSEVSLKSSKIVQTRFS
jgi:NDP-sugar pyrophosphorylase family protein